MTDQQSPESQPKLVRGEELETEDGVETPAQQVVGAEGVDGGGEWPDPDAPPRLPAPGAADD